MLKFSKDFVIALFVAIIFAYGFKSWRIGVYIIIWYAIIKIIWRFFTR